MSPYLDAGFLLTLLIRTNGTAKARETLAQFEPPFVLNLFHQLQAENFLIQLTRSAESERQRAGEAGLRYWKWNFSEGIFTLAETDWNSALRLAITWNVGNHSTPPAPLLQLHPAAAVISGATHLLSFDPRSREVANRAGLKLLPDTL